MKRIAFYSADPGNHRFIQPIIDRLALSGYECQLYNNWAIDDKADILWFDFADNNLIVATKENAEFLKSKKVIARLHAVEAYMGFYKQIDWSCVNHLIFVSEHMKRKCADADYKKCQLHVIHNGIDLKKFTFNHYPYPENVFGYVGNIVPQKGLLSFIQTFDHLRKTQNAKFYLAGLSRMQGREGEYWEYMKTKIGGVYEEGPVEDVNAWLDAKKVRYLIQPSYSESFSIIVAEAMAKGIKPLINNYVGAEDLWPNDLIYQNPFDLVAKMKTYSTNYYREWVTQRYDIDKQVGKIKELL